MVLCIIKNIKKHGGYMKVQLITQSFSKINRVIPKAEQINNKFITNATNLLSSDSTPANNGVFKFFKNVFSKKQKSEQFGIADSPVIANLKSYYKTAGEKLNDIFLENQTKGFSTVTVEHNLDAYSNLPKVIKDCLKPSDISIDGHISQSTINKFYEAAKGAKKIPESSYPPSFWGNPAEHGTNALENVNLDSIGHFDLSDEIPSHISQAFEGKMDSSYDIFDNVASKIDTGIDQIGEGLSHVHDLAADKISSVAKAAGLEHCDGIVEKASHLIDKLIDVATGGH